MAVKSWHLLGGLLLLSALQATSASGGELAREFDETLAPAPVADGTIQPSETLGEDVPVAETSSDDPLGDATDVVDESSTAEPAAPECPPAKKKSKPKPPPAPYKGVFYDNDFSYLRDPANQEWHASDAFKQVSVGDCWLIDVGGEYRLRHHVENNLRGSNLTGGDDQFLLQRTRAYSNVRYGNWLRFYGEAIDATSSFEDFAPRTIEENRFDALNLFADVLLWGDGQDESLWARGGRQELLLGDQRLVSPLDWSNTRRTFDGARFLYKSSAWDVDGFWTQPVSFAQHVNNDHNFDRPDQSQNFSGLYGSYKARKDHVYDLYFLRLSETDGPGTVAFPVDYDANLFGARWKGKHQSWLIDMEGGYQFGDFGALDQSAGFATGGLGYEWSAMKWKPTVWGYYDWASGDSDPLDGRRGTFNQLFPLGHKYFGYADLVARQNIQDVNFLVTAKPTKKLNLLAWWHIFHLAEARDSLYNANGTPIRSDFSGAAGTDVGQELDLTAQYNFSSRFDVLVGYSHFWAGDFVEATNPVGVSGDVDFYYTQASWRF